MFIDRHDAPGLTPEEVAEAHHRDVDIQDQFGVRYHTYWFDPENGSVFCLAEGPSRQAVEDVHQQAHGQTAFKVIEIGEAPLNAFLGTLPLYPAGTPYTAPAMRAIVFTDLCGSVAQTQQLGDDGHMKLLGEHNAIVREALTTHDGREVKHTGDGIMAAFTSIAAAVAFAVAVQRSLDDRNQEAAIPIHLSIGISAGEPSPTPTTTSSVPRYSSRSKASLSRRAPTPSPGAGRSLRAVRVVAHGADRPPIDGGGCRT